jgi:hypothetical protein
MVRITRPVDIPQAAVANEYSVTRIAPDPTYEARVNLSQTVERIVNAARDQQIDNEVRSAALQMRERLDALRTEIEEDPDHSTMPERWAERSQEIDEEFTERMRAPAARRAWRERADPMLSEERRYVAERVQTRTVEQARAGLIGTLGQLSRTMTDPDAIPDTRAQAMREIESAIANGVLRRTINADDGARMLEGARNQQAEFQRTEGLRAQEIAEADRIWAEAGGDYAVAQELAREIENAQVRDGVEERLATRYSRDEAGAQETLEDAMERAYSMIEETGSLDGLTQGDRRVIAASGNMDTLRTYIRARAGGGADTPNQASENLRYQLMSLNGVTDGVSTTRIFAQIPLTTALTEDQAATLQRYGVNVVAGLSIRAQLQPDDFEAVRHAHAYARGEEGAGQGNTLLQTRVFNMLWASAQDGSGGVLPDDINGRSSGNGGLENQRRFQAYLSREAEAFARERNREPTAVEVRSILRMALLNTRTSTTVLGIGVGGTNRPLYRAGADRIPRIAYEQIPTWHRDRLRRELIAGGVTASTEQDRRRAIEDAYMNWLAAGMPRAAENEPTYFADRAIIAIGRAIGMVPENEEERRQMNERLRRRVEEGRRLDEEALRRRQQNEPSPHNHSD